VRYGQANKVFRQYKQETITVNQFYSHGNVIPFETEMSLKVVFIMSEAANFENIVWGEISILSLWPWSWTFSKTFI